MADSKKPTQHERIAAMQHEFWSEDVQWLFGESQVNDDGSLTIPTDVVAKLRACAEKPFAELTKEEQGLARSRANRVQLVDIVGDLGGVLVG